jgi:hypothetical protein
VCGAIDEQVIATLLIRLVALQESHLLTSSLPGQHLLCYFFVCCFFDFVFFKRLDSHNHMHRDSNPNFVSVDEPLEDQWPESEVLAMSKLPQVL